MWPGIATEERRSGPVPCANYVESPASRQRDRLVVGCAGGVGKWHGYWPVACPYRRCDQPEEAGLGGTAGLGGSMKEMATSAGLG